MARFSVKSYPQEINLDRVHLRKVFALAMINMKGEPLGQHFHSHLKIARNWCKHVENCIEVYNRLITSEGP
jgi:hypothetical protein